MLMMMARNGLFPDFLPDEFSIFQHQPPVRVEKVLAITGERKITFNCQCALVQFNRITSFTRYTRSGRVVILRFILRIIRIYFLVLAIFPPSCSMSELLAAALAIIQYRNLSGQKEIRREKTYLQNFPKDVL